MQSKTWTRVLQWLFRNACDFKDQEVRVTPSMKHLGYRLQHTSIPGRARLVHGIKAFEMLAWFFHTTKGRRVNLRGDFVISASGGHLLQILYVLMLPWCCVHLVASCFACCSYNNHLFSSSLLTLRRGSVQSQLSGATVQRTKEPCDIGGAISRVARDHGIFLLNEELFRTPEASKSQGRALQAIREPDAAQATPGATW